MNIEHFSSFVKARTEMLSTRFTLNGEPVSSHDLSDPTGLLPLIALETGKIISVLSPNKTTSSTIVVPADPSTHMLGSKVEQLPELPEGVLHLYINSAILSIARQPSMALELPRDLSEASLLSVSELSAHIKQFPQLVVSHLAFNAQSNFEPR